MRERVTLVACVTSKGTPFLKSRQKRNFKESSGEKVREKKNIVTKGLCNCCGMLFTANVPLSIKIFSGVSSVVKAAIGFSITSFFRLNMSWLE